MQTPNAIEVPIVQTLSFNPTNDRERPSVRQLVQRVVRAADELEGQGARSDRIALQLLEALARYECESAEELAGQ
jgi:hypothetical protein